jgi:hypothetical protein
MMRHMALAYRASESSDILTAKGAALRLRLTTAGVRHIAAAGVLPYFRTENGQYLFQRADVERVARDREAMRGEHAIA